MAIDIEKTRTLLESMQELFDAAIPDSVSKKDKDFIVEKILGPAKDEIEKLINESRPPVIFLMGRSGHGKSSLINALAGKREKAKTSTVKPGTQEVTRYDIQFEETKCTWTIYDSRGYFETSKGNTGNYDTAKNLLKKSILKCKPDVILHVISMPEIRNLSEDITLYSEISNELKSETGSTSPTIIVLNNSDLIGNPHEWPPEKSAFKAGLINEGTRYLSEEVLATKKVLAFHKGNSLYGVALQENNYLAIIPTCALWSEEVDDRWNIETLIDYIGEKLPNEALLHFSQAIKRKHLLMKIADNLIKRFTQLSGIIGSTPIPMADIPILSSLQVLLIAIIAALSCRSVTKDNFKDIASEIASATGIAIGSGYAFRELCRWILNATGAGVPVGMAISGVIAAGGTYAIGKSAKAYFFNIEIGNLNELFLEGKKKF